MSTSSMAPPMSKADSILVSDLQRLSTQKKRLAKSSAYQAPADPEITVRSWKLDEFKYYDVPSPFPTLARGLFTQWVPGGEGSTEGDSAGQYRIVARGYDKFFNIGEVPWTTWAAIESHTSPPYVMTLKSNGCIIFIAALTRSKLLVTSKHSLGPVKGSPISHAEAGEKWLLKHLEQKGKTAEQLAEVLWDSNWTAVAELCDDSFEEHVLPYSLEKTGLHLHGINESTGAFKTQSPQIVASFSREWGFIETLTHTVDSVPAVRAFTDEIGRTGKWAGESIEGFVVRCHIAAAPAPTADRRSAPPYPPGSSFFFKVKYDEPYMMYRDWREITKTLLTAKGPLHDAKIPKSKLRRPESHLYRKWVVGEISRDRAQFADFNKGKGIIATRERFLQWMQSEKGEKELEVQSSEHKEISTVANGAKAFGKTIIVPVAIPGCGKTAIAVALKHLFGFGHTQSDDVRAKKPAPVFIQNVVNELKTHDVVIADKNNHLQQHRADLRKAVAGMSPPVRLLALNWALDKPPAMVHRICADRVARRGDNHQTLRADAVAKSHEEAIWLFISKAEELADVEVDAAVEMDVAEDLEQGLARAVDACVRVLGLRRPDAEEIGLALAAARAYEPARKATAEGKKAMKQPRYFGLLPEVDVEALVEQRLTQEDAPEAAKTFWEGIKKDKRVTNRPHVTVVHSKSLPQEQDLWDRCRRLFLSSSPPTFEFALGHLVFDERVMAMTVNDFKVTTDPGEDTHEDGREFVSELDDAIKNWLHITVGTRRSDIQAVEAGIMVDGWKRGQAGPNVGSLPLDDIIVKGRIKGLFN